MDIESRNVSELRRDFESALSKINFDLYNPLSAEFNTALNLGVMLSLLEREARAVPSDARADARGNAAANDGQAASPDESVAADDIDQLLILAKKYVTKYGTTADATFKTIAFDLTKDAKFLTRRALTLTPTPAERTLLKEYEARADEISKLI